ncbi:ornithine carbamoyltransferase [Halogeometricum borinquense]|uniref:Ornithine carbamoyltransferase n=1 Tax=Halogeometricum borinquense TaxID=60847 RepID=A0A6C0UE77_9EURY|nr:ornithine carbamoyltransferase [Halogeometricum borinquense]QIB72823.1 ornithine carbamoyltransferase [Halogeometricum borinquense]QIQ75222.1 ornithine carbamoyltransferase [Halogeometricum borinquense]
MPETTHFLDIDDLTTTELHHVLDRAAAIKAGEEDPRLEDQTLGMLFEKPSTRTRISFETGMTQLGGHAIFLGPEDIQLGHGEPLSDTSRVLSRYVDVVMARLFDHEDLVEIADYADVPVVNGLTDDAHPCQTLADLLTIREAFGGFEDVQAAWVGDGNNVGQSFVLGCAMAGLDLTVATPEEYGIDEEVLAHAAEYGGEPTIAETPAQAVADADVVYTDVWISMGQEDERDEKIAAFEGYQVNEGLLAETDAEVMHCLPAHRGEEISHDVLESDRALVWDQAENRLHAQKGLLVELLNK